MPRRYFIYLVVLAVILGCGWFKERANQRDASLQLAWKQRFDQLMVDGQAEYKRLVESVRKLSVHPDARPRIEAELKSPLQMQVSGDHHTAEWIHPKYGIVLTFDFYGDKLGSHGARFGTGNVLKVCSQPAWYSRSDEAERPRRMIAGWAWKGWLVAALCAFLSRRYGQIAAELSILCALVAGCAWLVDPYYNLSARGVFSNDRLGFAAFMYATGIVLLAVRTAGQQGDEEAIPALRFRLRSLLAAVTSTAALMAFGGVGWVTIAVLAAGVTLFTVVRSFVHLGSAHRVLAGSARAPSNERVAITGVHTNC